MGGGSRVEIHVHLCTCICGDCLGCFSSSRDSCLGLRSVCWRAVLQVSVSLCGLLCLTVRIRRTGHSGNPRWSAVPNSPATPPTATSGATTISLFERFLNNLPGGSETYSGVIGLMPLPSCGWHSTRRDLTETGISVASRIHPDTASRHGAGRNQYSCTSVCSLQQSPRLRCMFPPISRRSSE